MGSLKRHPSDCVYFPGWKRRGGDSEGRVQEGWLPQLKDKAAQINATFTRIFAKVACAGEVVLHVDEEKYERSAMNIRRAAATAPRPPSPLATHPSARSMSPPSRSASRFDCTAQSLPGCVLFLSEVIRRNACSWVPLLCP